MYFILYTFKFGFWSTTCTAYTAMNNEEEKILSLKSVSIRNIYIKIYNIFERLRETFLYN